ncbi:MAG: FAD-dependent oxidoreductase [Acidobacteria bacterium]|uniref:FAD-dependent oxidoreductase n=1 Tax=Candidatus Polarisedimenticola svalbardensis TaxID=2886004 RepID=A0A8J6XUE9_9BACT|nr:FAD-dependent oxidoreductase [Candidatus Polarisedimenticola svalbardensis]
MLPPEKVDLQWLEANVPCKGACPVGTDAGRYVALIAEGRFREAYAVARRPNPLASICGRICAAPCEDACRRGELDAPVAIRALKRFVTERFGVESMIDLDMVKEIYGKRGLLYPDDRIAVVGAGPAGLAAAHDLALLGYPVTVFEAQPVAGGMLRLGIPEYRLPRELIKLEVNAILSLGVEIRVNQRMGRDYSLADLRSDGYRAVFLAVGAHKGRELAIPGVELDGVVNGVDFLLNANMGYRLELGQRIVVVGGGNVALDVARTALRTTPPEEVVNPEINIVTALDIARSAIRFGVRDVHIVSLESADEMPAAPEEIEQAAEEGITFNPGRGPVRVLGDGGRVVGLETIQCSAVFDGKGRFNPSFVPGTELAMAADSVILAIGQTCDLSFIRPEDGIELTARGTIAVNTETLATSAPGIYSGGDVAFGPRLAINAVADGRRAASSIHSYLQGSLAPHRSVEVVLRPLDGYNRERDFEGIPRVDPPTLPTGRRVGIAEVEQGYSEKDAREQASRCLRCWVNTVFHQDADEGTECILCGGCADVCPESCIEFAPVSDIAIAAGLGPEIDSEFGEDSDGGVALIKDETICIRCGLCALRCPPGTIRMEAYTLEEANHVEQG